MIPAEAPSLRFSRKFRPEVFDRKCVSAGSAHEQRGAADDDGRRDRQPHVGRHAEDPGRVQRAPGEGATHIRVRRKWGRAGGATSG